MKISIITICYNDRLGFEKTAKSIVQQTNKDFEWIVIDGGSNDGSVEIQKGYNSEMAYYVSEKDGGIYNAMNKGVLHAKGEYCIFLNSGDYFCSPRVVERIYNKSLIGDIIAFDMFANIGKRFHAYNEAPEKINFQRLMVGSIGHQSTLIKTELLRNTPYREDLKIASDWVFWFEILLKQHKTYQAINIPVCVFDMSGISESVENINRIKEERRTYLNTCFSDDIVEHITSNCNVYSSLDGSYIYGIERKIQKVSYRIISIFFAYVIRGFIKRYKNIKYRKFSW